MLDHEVISSVFTSTPVLGIGMDPAVVLALSVEKV